MKKKNKGNKWETVRADAPNGEKDQQDIKSNRSMSSEPLISNIDDKWETVKVDTPTNGNDWQNVKSHGPMSSKPLIFNTDDKFETVTSKVIKNYKPDFLTKDVNFQHEIEELKYLPAELNTKTVYPVEKKMTRNAPLGTIKLFIPKIVRIIESKYLNSPWNPNENIRVNEICKYVFLKLKKNPSNTRLSKYDGFTHHDQELLKKIIKSAPYVIKHYVIKPYSIYNIISKKSGGLMPHKTFKEAIENFSTYKKIISYDRAIYIDRIKYTVKLFLKKLNKPDDFHFDINIIGKSSITLYKKILDLIIPEEGKNSIETLHKNPYNVAVGQISAALIYLSLNYNNTRIHVEELEEILDIKNVGKALTPIYQVIEDHPDDFDFKSTPWKKYRTLESYKEKLKNYVELYSDHLSVITKGKISVSTTDQEKILDLFNKAISNMKSSDSNNKFSLFYDSLGSGKGKSPKHLAAVLLLVYLRFYKDLNIFKKDFVELLNKQEDVQIGESTIFSLYKLFMDKFFRLDKKHYHNRVVLYIESYINRIKAEIKDIRLKQEFNNTFIEYIKNLYNIAVNKNSFPILNLVNLDENRETHRYCFPQFMALTLIYVAIKTTEEFHNYAWIDLLENLFAEEFEASTLYKFKSITSTSSNLLFEYLFTKDDLKRFKGQHYSHEDFIEELEKRLSEKYHLETEFLLKLYKLSNFKNPSIFSGKLMIWERSNVSVILQICQNKIPFRKMNTFSNIRKFILQNLKGESRKIALNLLLDLKDKRIRENEYIWDFIYNEITSNNNKSIRPADVLNQLDFLINSSFTIRQINKFSQIIRLVLDYDQMLNHIEIANKVAPNFGLKSESLTIEIQNITSFLDNKDSFNKRERFPQITFPKQPPMISEFAEELLLPNFYKLYSHLREVNRLKGFPDHILESFKDPNTNDERISNFSGRLTNIHENRKIQRSIKTGFVERLINKGIINTFYMEDHLDPSGLDSFSKTLWNLCYYCRNIHYEKKEIWAGHGSPAHEVVLPKIFNELSEVVAIELPIWDECRNKYLTGHIDTLLKIEYNIDVADYKPNESPYFSEKIINSSFLNSLPQIAMYGYEIKKLHDIGDMLCITFNKKGVWYYKPELILRELKDFLDNYSVPSEKRSWEDYIDFL